MKFLLTLSLFFSFSISYSQTFKVDTQNALVNFNYLSESTTGTIKDVQATIDLNLLDLSTSKINGTAFVNSLSTGNSARDLRLKSKTYFNAALFPEMTFTGSGIKKVDEHYEVSGTMSIKGFKKPVVFIMDVKEDTLVFKTSIFADDFGVAVKPGKEASVVEIELVLPTK